MGKSYLKKLLFVSVCSMLVFYAAQGPSAQAAQNAFKAYDFNPQLKAGQYRQKVDNFLIILDASGSMAECYKGQPKVTLAKETVNNMNQTIPDLYMVSGLRAFGKIRSAFSIENELVYGPALYSTAGVNEGLNAVRRAGGFTPLAAAISYGTEDLKTSQGKIAVIIFSDAKEVGNEPVLAAKDMKNQLGDRVCIYTVLIGNDLEGKKIMDQIAQAGMCGCAVSADSLDSGQSMADFVEMVFLVKCLDSDGDGVYDPADQCPNTPKGVIVDARGCPFDSDGDGVYDYLDQCPNTPKGVKVDAKGCPLDTDGDGVYDYLDKCPGTPRGAIVDTRGCWVLEGVLFDTAKWSIKNQYYPVLEEVVSVLKANPSLKLQIAGHTDSRASAEYNQKLSENRAKAVKDYLVKRGIKAGSLTTKGYGLSMPIAPNDTPEGMAKNRRVELTPIR
jgi:OOP family OmpA-OmpF porin